MFSQFRQSKLNFVQSVFFNFSSGLTRIIFCADYKPVQLCTFIEHISVNRHSCPVTVNQVSTVYRGKKTLTDLYKIVLNFFFDLFYPPPPVFLSIKSVTCMIAMIGEQVLDN